MHGKFSCFVIGEGTLPVLCAQELVKASSEILGIISPDGAVLRWAQAHAVRGFSTAAIDVLRQTPYDYLFSIANRVILSEEILSTPRRDAINFHDAPLPKYAGVHATSWALIQGEREHGITWHTMAADKIDGGEILKQVLIPVSPTETTLSLNAKCFGAGVKAFAELIRELGAGSIRREPQDFSQRSYFSASRRPTGAGILSWQMSGREMEALVRALDVGSYANTLSSAKLVVGDSWLIVDKLQALSTTSSAAAGTIVGVRDDALVVATASCDVMIRQLRTADGEMLSAGDLANRFELSPGHRFDEISPDQRSRIAALAESVARYESTWTRRLRGPGALAISAARSADRAATGRVLCHQGALRASEIREFLKVHDAWSVGSFLLAAHALYLSRVSGEKAFAVGLGHRKLRDEIRGLESFFACPVPLTVDVDGDERVTQAIDDLVGRLDSTRASRTYLRDLAARYPDVSPTRFSVVLEDSDHDGASRADFDLTFTASEAGDECRWTWNAGLLSREDVEAIHDSFSDFLSALMGAASGLVRDVPVRTHRRWLRIGPAVADQEVPEMTRVTDGADRRSAPVAADKTEQRAILQSLKEGRISPEEARRRLEGTLRRSRAPETTSPKADARARAATNQVPEPVAVVGMSGRFPGARNIREFWKNLQDGVDSVKEVTPDRWDIDRYYDSEPGKAGKIYSRCAGFIDDIDRFDPSFFNISPKEAEQMEPQYRLLLQETWRAIEDAGYRASSLSGTNVGIFVGASVGDYSGDNVQVPSLECSRIAYLFDWRGPCICIETACSSALVAVHEACVHIGTRQMDMAVVGGMNLMVTPNAYRYLSGTYALSTKGRCFSFDRRADGTIFSEGVCAIVLKRLSAAQADRDHIYGVIKGSGINYDGKTNGITAPSGKAQMELEAGIYRQFDIDPETITMVEAHGTGTTLGDPIEADALNKAFRKFTQKKSFCALGSVKSNIGHTGFASGLVGMIKVLLSLEHRQIPATINYQDLNPAISLADSPFYINTALRDWVGGSPRVAAVSSFGFSGTNAHVVVEEGPTPGPSDARAVEVARPARVVPLSARNRDRLREAASNLLRHLREESSPARPARIDLTDLAYTLQVGREAMSCRVVFLVHSLDELIDGLAGFVEADDDRERGGPGTWFRGDVNNRTAEALRLGGDEPRRDQARRWAEQGTLGELAASWAKGVEVDWALLYPELAERTGDAPADRPGPRRISLPTYPFAEERHWIERSAPGLGAAGAPAWSPGLPDSLHPLLHANTSDLAEQRFSSRFSGEEHFLRDHRVKGQKVLPGVAYLEMALVAVQRACGGRGSARTAGDGGVRLDGIRLTNVVWARPIAVGDEPIEVNIGLFPQDDGGVAYEVYTQGPGPADKSVVHSQGVAVLTAAESPPPLDLAALQAGLDGDSLSPQACYAAFSALGIDYGPAHRGLERIYVGEREVLAKLTLPACVTETRSQFTLHPSLLDSALQATIGIGTSEASLSRLVEDRRSRPSLPFALESLEVVAACEQSMWARIRSVGKAAAETGATSETVQKFDIDLCDERGTICVRLRGFSARVVKGAETERVDPVGTLLLRPTWEDRPATRTEPPREYAQTHVFLCGLERDPRRLQNDLAPASLVDLDADRPVQTPGRDGSTPWYRRFEHCAVGLFEAIQEIVRAQRKGDVLVQVLVPGGGRDRAFSAVSGLLKSAQLEHPRLVGQVIEVEGDESDRELLDRLRENAQSPQDRQIRYQGGRRRVASLAVADAPDVEYLPWKTGGVYWITGGAGGLGLIFATEIAEKVGSATLVLTGRSALTPERKARLSALESLGARIVYRSVDVSDRRAVAALVGEIESELGGLQGVVHAAGVLRDNFILKKTGAEFREVLEPKVAGLVNVDEATKELDLDFFVVFSSGAGEMGNAGQSDYATANAFMDAFADHRNSLEEANQRTGRTLSINWPLWRDGGMRVDQATEGMLRDKVGMVAMQTPSGMTAFYRCLASNEPRVMVVEGSLERMKRKLLPAQRPAQAEVGAPPEAPAGAVDAGDLLDKVQDNLIQMICGAMKLKAQDLDVDSELSEYGFDSISFTDLANRLNRKYGLELTPTVFFEYSSIGGFAKYLVDEHHEAVARQFEAASGQRPSPVEPVERDRRIDDVPGQGGGGDALATHLDPPTRRARFAGAAPAPAPGPTGPQPIAIVGMSGRFPMAADLDEFWSNLRASRDCIEEIPAQRWDWRAYYGDPQQGGNKTNIKWGGFIEGVDEFDPLFFGISPREAEIMDPHQRLLMTYIWLALEDAGYSAASLSGSRTGIFVATANNGYDSLIFRSNLAVERYSATGMAPSVGPNRMSYFLNVHGPSEPIDTACSSSLVAIHRAIIAMEAGDCDQALVGGVNTLVTPDAFIRFNKEGMLSEDGRCKTFSSRANGYVRGEGVGILYLKTLKAAEAAGDHIYGLVRASVENHGGRANSLTSPNPKAQADLLVRAYRKAGVDPRTVGYIEAHGTGTKLGDPIEIDALKNAFVELYRQSGETSVASRHCGLGSVKTNIGHLELASGVAGVIKVLLQFKHEMLVESLHCEEINPYIDLRRGPFYVVQEPSRWEAPRDESGAPLPRRAGVSSFGFGGVNAHVVLEEYRPARRQEASASGTEASDPVVVVLSAKNRERLRDYAEKLLRFVQRDGGPESRTSLRDLAYTLQVGRDAMDARLGLIVHSSAELAEKLQGFIEGKEPIQGLYSGQVKKKKEISSASGTDEELQAAVRRWMERQELAEVLELWVKGLTVDWSVLHADRRPQRISAPTYPFARERYWVEPRAASTADRRQSDDDPRAVPPEIHTASSTSSGPPAGGGEPGGGGEPPCLEETWEPVAVQPDPGGRAAWIPRRVLCLLSDRDRRESLRRHLEARCPETTMFFISTAESPFASDWRVEPGNQDSLRGAFQRIAEVAADVDAVLYLWPLEDPTFIEDAAGIATILRSLSLAALHPRRIVLAGAYGDALQRSHLESWTGFERSMGLAWPDTRLTALIREQGVGDSADWWPALWRELTRMEPTSVLYQGGIPFELRRDRGGVVQSH